MSFNPIKKSVFSTPGTYVWTCPPNVHYVDLVIIGGGGAGGGGGGGGSGGENSTYYGGGGGCSGGAGESGVINSMKAVKVTPGQTYTVIVGTGGLTPGGGAGSDAAGGSGESGGSSSFIFPNGFQLISAGGAGGLGGNNGSPGGSLYGNAPGGSAQDQLFAGSAGQQAGRYGGSPAVSLASAPYDFAQSTQYLYQIYTDIDFSVTAAGQPSNFPPFGSTISSQCLGNTTSDSTLGGAARVSSGNMSGSSYGGGAGGIINLANPIPLYMIGLDFSTITSITLPQFVSVNDVGFGSGQTGPNGTGTSVSGPGHVYFWTDSTATQIGFGAGGLGGPGGGGGSGRGTNLNYGGSGYHGDIGLGGMVMISW